MNTKKIISKTIMRWADRIGIVSLHSQEQLRDALVSALSIDKQAATIARLTAAHAMQDESLVVLPRHMMNGIEEKLKEQAAYIEWANTKIEELERVK